MDNNDLSFLEKKDDLFKQIDQERKVITPKEITDSNGEQFINSLPDWDLPPLYESVRRVNRQ